MDADSGAELAVSTRKPAAKAAFEPSRQAHAGAVLATACDWQRANLDAFHSESRLVMRLLLLLLRCDRSSLQHRTADKRPCGVEARCDNTEELGVPEEAARSGPRGGEEEQNDAQQHKERRRECKGELHEAQSRAHLVVEQGAGQAETGVGPGCHKAHHEECSQQHRTVGSGAPFC